MTVAPAPACRPTLAGHLELLRVDHWVKNVFVLPGMVVAWSLDPARFAPAAIPRLAGALLSVGLVASSNYVLNGLLDAPHDRCHPLKRHRAAPAGRIDTRLAWVQWLALMAAGVALGLWVSRPFALTMAALWGMGCVYNVSPLRTKDVPYLDVVSEAVNNPLRMLAGWYATGTAAVPITSLLLSYWMAGCYFMAVKRLAELRTFGSTALGTAYRRSFAYYTEARLLNSIAFYGSVAMLFFGAFIMRYRLELILAFPAVAWVMAAYLAMAFREGSAAQNPERLYRERGLMAAVSITTVLMLALLYVDVPALYLFFPPTVPLR